MSAEERAQVRARWAILPNDGVWDDKLLAQYARQDIPALFDALDAAEAQAAVLRKALEQCYDATADEYELSPSELREATTTAFAALHSTTSGADLLARLGRMEAALRELVERVDEQGEVGGEGYDIMMQRARAALGGGEEGQG